MIDKQAETLYRLKIDINTPLNGGSTIIVDKEDIETVLNMLEKKDKIIDLMAEQLAGLTIWNNDKEEPLILADKEEVKQYFERKSKE